MNPFILIQVPFFGASTGGGITGILASVTSFLTWALSSITSVVDWIIGDDLAMIYVSMFIVGFVVAYLFRILHTA